MTIKYFLTCTFLCAIFTIKAQENKLLVQAKELALQGNDLQAAILYERMLFNSPVDSNVYAAVAGRLELFKKQQKFKEAEKYLKASLFPGFTEKQRFELSVQQILCAYLDAQFENTLSLAAQLPVNYPGTPVPELIPVLQVLSLNELQRWKEGEDAYLAWARSKDSLKVQQNPYRKIPHFKSESKAEWLSTFIPGGGQIYAGKPLEGVVSILVQGAGIYFGVVSFLDKFYLSAWAGAGIFGSFHMGGVRRSTVLVQQYNKKKMAEFNAAVRKQML